MVVRNESFGKAKTMFVSNFTFWTLGPLVEIIAIALSTFGSTAMRFLSILGGLVVYGVCVGPATGSVGHRLWKTCIRAIVVIQDISITV